MRIFEHPNTSNNWVCPICETNEDKSIALIGIMGTEEDDNMQAEQFHLDCIDLYYYKDKSILAQQFN